MSLENRERFEIALNACIYSTYCLTLTPERIRGHTADFIGVLLKQDSDGFIGLPLAATAACKVLGIDSTPDGIRNFIASSKVTPNES